MKRKCDCCGFLTVEEEFDICPVCFWEQDTYCDPDCSGGANGISLREAKHNFRLLGVCDEKYIGSVRKPLPEEIPN